MSKPAIKEYDAEKSKRFYFRLDAESVALVKILAFSRGSSFEETIGDIVRGFVNRNSTFLESLKKTIENAHDKIQW